MKPYAFVLFLILGASVRAENWAQWRGPSFNGSSPETGLPEKFSKTEKLVWACPLSGESAATPIIWDERVFVTSHDDKTKDVQAVCVNRKDGSIRWKKNIGTAIKKASPTGKNTFASPSPITDGEHVWFTFGTGEIVAFDMEGQELWSKKLQDYGPLAYLHGYSSTPLLLDKKLYVELFRRTHPIEPTAPKPEKPYESYLICLDASSGKELWHHVRSGPGVDGANEAYTTPIPFSNEGNVQILTTGANVLTAHNPETGEEIWRWAHFINVGDSRTCCSPLICDKLICVGESQRNPTIAVHPGGKGDLPESYLAWKYPEFPANVGSPLFYNGMIYLVDHQKRTLSCLKPETGERVWAGKLGLGGEFYASPTGADGKVYCVNNLGEVFVVAAAPEFKILHQAQFEEGGVSCASIAVAHKHLFLRTAKSLYCIGD